MTPGSAASCRWRPASSARAIALQVVQNTIGLTVELADPNSQNRFVLIGLGIVAVGVAVAWVTGRTVFDLKADDPRIRRYLIGATAISAFALVFALFRLVFGPTGYFSAVDGVDADGDSGRLSSRQTLT